MNFLLPGLEMKPNELTIYVRNSKILVKLFSQLLIYFTKLSIQYVLLFWSVRRSLAPPLITVH